MHEYSLTTSTKIFPKILSVIYMSLLYFLSHLCTFPQICVAFRVSNYLISSISPFQSIVCVMIRLKSVIICHCTTSTSKVMLICDIRRESKMAAKMAPNEPHGTRNRSGNIPILLLDTPRNGKMQVKKIHLLGAWGPLLPTRLYRLHRAIIGQCIQQVGSTN